MPGGEPTDPNEIIRQVAERGLGIKFGRGVAAKTAYAMIALLVIWLGVIWKLGDGLMLNCFLIGAALAATAVDVWWIWSTQRFAERNPAQALLDGAEFIEYKKFEAEVKGGAAVLPGNSDIQQIGANR